ncbi:DUF1214 domain-containing protein [Echinicola sp. 20G]|uniref:DUF1214 domain-containing protein n=1 Tax=Echinicola sp. 20G TaxID=2781961 RepID=UPI001910C4F2|nr:DUF1214 domain-containing protein [Echinicola sp. 20G]
MNNRKKAFLSNICLILALGISWSCTSKTSKGSLETVTEQEVTNSYVYLLSRALVVRQEQMDFDGTGLEYNSIKYNEAGKADFVNPNLDVAYMEAWIAVDEHSAVTIEIPEIKDRYYTLQLLDGWGEVITNINERNYPDHPNGLFVLHLKDSDIDLPDDAFPIEVPVKKIKMLARVELQDTLEEAVSLQQLFKMSAIGSPNIAPTIPFPQFTNKELPTTELFSYAEDFLKTPDVKMNSNDSIRTIVQKVKEFIDSSPESKAQVDSIITHKTIPQFLTFATTKAGKFENGWLATLTAGNYNGDYWTRTSANFVGIWANTSEEVIYFIAAKDADGQVLGNGKSYSLTFPPENLPVKNVNAFWSVILVGFPDYRVVSNELNRFNFNNFSTFDYGEDGSLTLYISPNYDSKWPKSNWLPSPKDAAFNLTLRMYVPHENVLEGKWFPESLKVIE